MRECQSSLMTLFYLVYVHQQFTIENKMKYSFLISILSE